VREVRGTPPPIPADRPIRIAVLLREGDLEARPMRHGAALAAEEWNQHGGVHGRHRLEVTYHDEGATPESGLAAVRRALAGGADMIVGGRHPRAGASYVEEVVAAEKFLFLTTLGPPDAPKKWVADWDRYKTYFHLDPVGGFQLEPPKARSFVPAPQEHFLAVEMGAVFTNLQRMWGFDRIAFVRDEDPFFERALGVFEQAARKRGWTVTGVEVVGPETDHAALWKKLRAQKTQVVRFLLRDGVAFARAYGREKPPILAFGVVDGGASKEFWKATGGGAEGMIVHHKGGADVPMHFHSTWWQRRYLERFDDYPTTLGDDVYAAIHGFARALEQADTLDPRFVAATLERLEFPVGPGFFGWYPITIGACHIRAGDKLRAVWDSQWHAGGKLVPVWTQVHHGEAEAFPLAQRYVIDGNLRLPHGLRPAARRPAK
jgi:ABC-type branched-subunit amino acid transport system substrate-binding protein